METLFNNVYEMFVLWTKRQIQSELHVRIARSMYVTTMWIEMKFLSTFKVQISSKSTDSFNVK